MKINLKNANKSVFVFLRFWIYPPSNRDDEHFRPLGVPPSPLLPPLGLRVTKQHEEHEGENLFHPTANYGSHRIIYFIYFTCATCFQ